MDIIQTILKDSNYHLALFTKKEIEDLQETIFTKITRGKEPPLYKACSVYLSGLRLSDGQLLIVANASFNPNAIEEYGLRWEIETLFGCLKGRGFNLEDTRVVGYLRMKKLFVLPVIAFCWSHKVGEWKNDCVLPIKTKTHQRLAQSIFRYGLDCIRSELFNAFSQTKKQVKKILSLLRPALSDNKIYGESVRC